MLPTLVDMAWLEATRLVALYCREDLKVIRAATAGRREALDRPSAHGSPRKLAMHLTVEGARRDPGDGRQARLGRDKGTVYHALADIARERETTPTLDMELRALELRMMHWRSRTRPEPPGHIPAAIEQEASAA